VHSHVTSPLLPGQSLPVGHWRSTCGLLSLIPEDYTNCQNSVLEMTADGLLTFSTPEDNAVLWQMKGNCPEEGEECVADITESGGILIAGATGKVVKGGKGKDNISLTPWPFATEPMKKNRNKKK